jgi:hypothetical protein
VADIARITAQLLASLQTHAEPRNREQEEAKAKTRGTQRHRLSS